MVRTLQARELRNMRLINTLEELATLPELSVIQFLGGDRTMKAAWQLDEAWYPVGNEDYLYTHQIPEDALPARVFWTPEDEE